MANFTNVTNCTSGLPCYNTTNYAPIQVNTSIPYGRGNNATNTTTPRNQQRHVTRLTPKQTKAQKKEAKRAQHEKRTQQQTPTYSAPSAKQLLATNQNVTTHDACVSGNEGAWFSSDAFGNQKALLFSAANGIVNVFQNASSALSSLFGPKVGVNHISAACDSGTYQVLTSDGASPANIRHKVIEAQTVKIPEYLAGTDVTGVNKAPTPGKLLGDQAVYAPVIGTELKVTHTDANGRFNVSNSDSIFNATSARNQEVTTFSDGSHRVTQARALPGLYEVEYNATGQRVTTREINSGQTIDQAISAKTPIPINAKYTSKMTPGIGLGGTSQPTLYTEDIDLHQISYITPLGNEPDTVARPSIANCGAAFPTIHVTARESFDAASGKWVIKYDVIDSATNSNSLIGGEQTYNYPPITSHPNPIAGCFGDGTPIVIFRDEDQNPSAFTMQINAPLAPATVPSPAAVPSQITPSPMAQPSPAIPSPLVESPSIVASPSSNRTEEPIIIEFTQQLNITQNFTPITSEVLFVSNNTAYIKFVDEKGTEVIFTATGVDVPLCVEYPTELFANGTFSVKCRDKVPCEPPVLEGCSEDRTNCAPSRVKSQLETVVEISDSNTLLIAITVSAGAAALITAAGLIFYFAYLKPLREKREANRFVPKTRHRGAPEAFVNTPRKTPEELAREDGERRDAFFNKYMKKLDERSNHPQSEVKMDVIQNGHRQQQPIEEV